MTEATTTPPITTAPAPSAPAPVEVKLGDATFKVDAAVAAALTAAQKAATDAGVAAKEVETRLNAQLVELQKKVPQATTPTPSDDKGIDVLLFSDPKEAAKQIKEEAKAELRAELQQSEAQKTFWVDFYDAHPELKDDDLVVKAIVSRDYGALKDLKVDEAIKKLGESVQKYLLERGVERKKTKKGAVTEGGNEPGAPVTKKKQSEPSPTPTTSLTAVLRQRQEARRKAAGGAATSN